VAFGGNTTNQISSSGVASLVSATLSNNGTALSLSGTNPAIVTNSTNSLSLTANATTLTLGGTAGTVGLGTSSSLATLDIRGQVATAPIASFSGATTNAGVIVDNSGSGDLFTASKSGATKFVIQNNGNIEVS